uniref:hypothetical protein n=1 Tax=Paenirhodobacter enshiensis TaxID=1105367 RepID=UPI0035B10322
MDTDGRGSGEADLPDVSATAAEGDVRENAIHAPNKDASSRFSMPIPVCPIWSIARALLCCFLSAVSFFQITAALQTLGFNRRRNSATRPAGFARNSRKIRWTRQVASQKGPIRPHNMSHKDMKRPVKPTIKALYMNDKK